jgi:hypothetical protein
LAKRFCYSRIVLSQTPLQRLVDAQGRPYFLWDCEMTLAELKTRLNDPDPDVRAYLLGKVMRQAKPDDALALVTLREITDLWPRIERHLGRSRAFWRWLLSSWGVIDDAGQ